MKNKTNIAELLKDCPKGMELDCTMYENVEFDYIDPSPESIYPIHCLTRINGGCNTLVFTHNGCNDRHPNAKCVIFPKGKTTWEGFVPPCKFKDGDVIFTHANCLKVGLGNTWISIFQEKRNRGVATYVDISEDGKDYYDYIIDDDKALLCMDEDIMRQRFATEEEKSRLFDAIKDNGYRWNEETKTLEKLIEPNFKVGDKIRHKTHIRQGNAVTEIKDTHYILDDELALPFISQDEYELVPNKFDITTLNPFDKVLTRDCNEDKWNIDFFSYYRNDGSYQCMTFTKNQCIPYEANKELLGTTNDCDDFYKTWEK